MARTVWVQWVPPWSRMSKSYRDLAARFRGDLREPLMRAIREVIIPSIEENFASEGRPKWAALSDVTIKVRSALGFGAGPILSRTGEWENTATSVDIWAITKRRAVARFDALPLQGRFAEMGTSTEPARPAMIYQAEDFVRVEQIFWDYIEKAWNETSP